MPLDVDGEESPTAGDALEFLFALVIERDARTSYEVFDGGGDEDLPGCSESRDSRTDVHGHAGDVLAADLELTGVESSADVDAQSSEGVANGDGAVDGSSRSVEGGHEFISDRVDFLAAEALQLAAHGPVVAVEDLTPLAVAQLSGALGGADDVGEQHRRQHSVGVGGGAYTGQEFFDLVDVSVAVASEDEVVGPGYLNQPAAGDALGQVLGVGPAV